jgi:hypothetical protein
VAGRLHAVLDWRERLWPWQLCRIPHLRTKLAEKTYRVSQNTGLYQNVCYLPLVATGEVFQLITSLNQNLRTDLTKHNTIENVVLTPTHNTQLPSPVYSRMEYVSYWFWNITCPDVYLRRHSWRQSCSRQSNRAAAAVRTRNLAYPVWVSGSPSHHRPAFCLCSLASGKRTFFFSSGPAAEILVTSIISPALLSKTFVTPTDKNYLSFRHGPFIH